MPTRNTCPAAVSGWPSRGSRTQPVPSIAACLVGSASTAKIASAGALMIVVALMVSSVMVVPPCELSWVPDLTPGAPACLVLLPVICFSFPGRSARSGTALAGKGRTVKRAQDISGEKARQGKRENQNAVSRARTAPCADGPAGGAVRPRWAPGSPRREVVRPRRSCGRAGTGCPPGQRAIDGSTPGPRWSSGQPARLGAVALGNRDRPVERHHRAGRDRPEQVVKADNPVPVRLLPAESGR